MPRSLLLASTVSLGLLSGFIFILVVIFSIFIGDMGGGLIGAITTTIVINFLLWLVSPWCSDWMYRFFYKNQWTTLEELAVESPKTAEIIRKICEAEKIKLPKIGIIPDDNPNAFTYGSGPWNARIIITHGIIRFLSDEERSSVVAHELGHIANRDFIIMTIASTLLQILYEIYYYTNKQKKGNSDSRSKLAIVGLIALIFYWLGSYILLYLSRVREYAADAFSAKYTDANLLADALIKIAMGILSTPGDARLVKSTRYIGVAGDAVSKQLGLVYKNCEKSGSFELLGRSLLFDLKSPWAFLAELSSTHPLSGKRIGALMKQTLAPKYDLASIEARLQIDTDRLYRGFARDLTLVIIARLAPWILGLITLIALLALHIPIEGGFLFVVTGFLVGIVVSMLIKLSMMYPANQDEPTTILEAMGDIYASPVRGRKISLEGQLVGRGIPGYIFSEDMLMQDKTGLIYVDYESRFGWIGNLFYSLKKAAENIGKDVRTSGWFFRDMSSRIVADRITGEGIDLKGGVRLWMLIGIMLMTVVSGVVGMMANTIYTDYTITEQSKFIATNKEPTKEDLIVHPNWKFRDQYDVVYEFSDGVAKIVKDGKVGMININGDIIIPLGKYETMSISEGRVIAVKGEKCSLLDQKGKEIKSFECSLGGFLPKFSDGLAVKTDIYIGNKRMTDESQLEDGEISTINNVIDKNGEVIIEAGKYGYIGNFHNGLAQASTGKISDDAKVGFIDKNGEVIIPMEYDHSLLGGDFSGGIVILEKSKKFGIINKNNEIIAPFEYEHITKFYNGYAFAEKEKECGIMDEKGIFTPFHYECKISDNDNYGLGYITKKDEQIIITKDEKIILSGTGTHISFSFANERIIKNIQMDEDFEKKGWSDKVNNVLFDLNGKQLAEMQYSLVQGDGFWYMLESKKGGRTEVGYLYPDGYVKWIK